MNDLGEERVKHNYAEYYLNLKYGVQIWRLSGHYRVIIKGPR